MILLLRGLLLLILGFFFFGFGGWGGEFECFGGVDTAFAYGIPWRGGIEISEGLG